MFFLIPLEAVRPAGPGGARQVPLEVRLIGSKNLNMLSLFKELTSNGTSAGEASNGIVIF